MSTLRYPQGDVAGMECVYCPECGEPDPDGMPDVEAFEVFGVTACPECAAALFERENDAERGSPKSNKWSRASKRSAWVWGTEIDGDEPA